MSGQSASPYIHSLVTNQCPFSWLSASIHLPFSLQATKSAQWGLLVCLHTRSLLGHRGWLQNGKQQAGGLPGTQQGRHQSLLLLNHSDKQTPRARRPSGAAAFPILAPRLMFYPVNRNLDSPVKPFSDRDHSHLSPIQTVSAGIKA